MFHLQLEHRLFKPLILLAGLILISLVVPSKVFQRLDISIVHTTNAKSLYPICKTNEECKENERCTIYLRCVEKENEYATEQDINVDYLTYKIVKVESFTEMGASVFKKETRGKFIKVYLDITNNAKETKQIFTPRFTIIDSEDRKFDRVADDTLYISDGLEFGIQLNPSLTTSGAIIFEMPKESDGLKLEITGDWLSVSKVTVDLDNIKNVGKDTTLKEEQDRMMDEVMEEAEKQTQELMNRCNAPFTCLSSCPEYMDMGQMDCPPGHICCIQ